ncbi:tautomerase family protein [Streptomyces diastatochromogenes]|uniref:Tautomerase n=1 Tax=Streptomyces diastatochromogenes TaxID=42236 RepID=A0A233S590_STRDA|nr:tautomerase family protein [Streptomyces diastatochromogenes]MCZ0986830.1 tautomerase family protein [Streptomyces diastatochromogenes]OXY90856.1 tautomerase [Streptomyces diastatochromogenes]
MPVYTCTAAQGSLTSDLKARLAAEITRIHADINHVPPAYVNVVFSDLPADSVFAGGRPATPLILTGWVRRGHPQEEATRLALELSSATARISGVDESRIMVVLQDSPARSAVEGGHVLPEPGEEREWLRRTEA